MVLLSNRFDTSHCEYRLTASFDRSHPSSHILLCLHCYVPLHLLTHAIITTADSVSMVSEAAATAKPVHIVDLDGGSAKFERFHAAMRTAGITRPFRGTIEQWRYTPPDDTARAAVFLHFDGSVVCHSGASVGFPAETSRGFIDAWERRYRALFPYRFVGENFTTNERQYYGFRKVDAPEKLLIEFGEMTCPVQYAWMAPRLHELGDVVAEFLIEQTPR